VGHGHVTVNGRKVDVPSYLCHPGDVLSVGGTAAKMPDVQWAADAPSISLPSWLSRDGLEVTMIDWPTREEVEYPIDDNLIVEFYSR
jgi:small subunit ribosomal protein S4